MPDPLELLKANPLFRFVGWLADRLALWGCATILVVGFVAAMFLWKFIQGR